MYYSFYWLDILILFKFLMRPKYQIVNEKVYWELYFLWGLMAKKKWANLWAGLYEISFVYLSYFLDRLCKAISYC